MDFAPYQSSPPETERALSPIFSPRVSPANVWQQQQRPVLQHPQPQRAWTGDAFGGAYLQSPPPPPTGGGGVGDYIAAMGARESMVSEFDTSLGLRLDLEACLAYILLPPLGGILLLILEKNSDFVRFHAWQSSLLFTLVLILHLVISGSSFLTWVLILADIALVAWLVRNAYRDADTLDRYEVPIIGPIASKFLDDE